MNKRKLEISKSSLISLKAELSRKREEASTPKAPKVNIKKPVHKKPPVKEDDEKPITEEEKELGDKSRSILIAKSKLYEKLCKGEVKAESNAHFLVNFDEKENVSHEEHKILEESNENDFDDDDDDWVDYVDQFGRTRKCLKTDLHLYIDKKDDTKQEEEKPTVSEELQSWDMRREELRKKWAEEEEKLAEKRDLHYQDVLFDEARSHGVGYFSFSHDEEERAKQQEMFKKIREESKRQQQVTKSAKDRRKEQMRARLAAAKQRKRERLGLPPEEESEEEPQEDEHKEEKEKSDLELQFERQIEENLLKLRKATHVRDWDVGKAGVSSPPVMTQHEWVEKRRDIRIQEFAPPQVYMHSHQDKSLYFTSKRKTEPINIVLSDPEEEESTRKGVEVPPPTSYESNPFKISKPNDMAESIECGLMNMKKMKQYKATDIVND